MSKETLTEAQVEDIIYVGIRAWCAQQNPPLEFRDIEKYFCDLALAQKGEQT